MRTPRLVSTLVAQITAGAKAQGRISYNPWFHTAIGQVYVRYLMCRPPFDREFFRVIDLSNIEFYRHHRGRGYFGSLLAALEDFADTNDIQLRVSDVANRRLRAYLAQRPGWEYQWPHMELDREGWPTFLRDASPSKPT